MIDEEYGSESMDSDESENIEFIRPLNPHTKKMKHLFVDVQSFDYFNGKQGKLFYESDIMELIK